MIKVKILVAGYGESLERQINDWLAQHRTSNIVNIQFQYRANHVAYITYRDGS